MLYARPRHTPLGEKVVTAKKNILKNVPFRAAKEDQPRPVSYDALIYAADLEGIELVKIINACRRMMAESGASCEFSKMIDAIAKPEDVKIYNKYKQTAVMPRFRPFAHDGSFVMGISADGDAPAPAAVAAAELESDLMKDLKKSQDNNKAFARIIEAIRRAMSAELGSDVWLTFFEKNASVAGKGAFERYLIDESSGHENEIPSGKRVKLSE